MTEPTIPQNKPNIEKDFINALEKHDVFRNNINSMTVEVDNTAFTIHHHWDSITQDEDIEIRFDSDEFSHFSLSFNPNSEQTESKTQIPRIDIFDKTWQGITQDSNEELRKKWCEICLLVLSELTKKLTDWWSVNYDVELWEAIEW